MKRATALALAMAAMAFAACGTERSPNGRMVLGGEAADPLPAMVRVEIDAGNAAFRARDLAAARAHYLKATELDAGVFAGWYGLAMAAEAQGDLAAAVAARRRAQELAGDAPISPHPDRTASPHNY